MIDSSLTTNLPWSHPSVFQTILVMTGDPKTILSSRAVCSSWRDWVDQTGSLWGKMIPSLLKKAVRRMPMIDNLYQVWDLRLDLLLEMEDEVENEHQTRCLAFRLDRAIHQKLYHEYEDTLELLDELATAQEEGEMFYSSPTGPISLFVRCKVSHPEILRLVGECLADHLNTVVIDVRDKESAVIRQSLLRAMIGCTQAPRWVFKDQVGWLSDKLVVEDVNNADEEEQEVIEVKEEPTTTSSMLSIIRLVLFSLGSSFWSSIRGFIFSYMFSSPRPWLPEIVEEEVCEVDEDGVFQLAPTPLHPDFPTVLELLDFDAPWLRALLVQKAKINNIIVLPNFQNVSLMTDIMDSNLKIVGYDEDCAVVQMDCSSLQSTDQGVVIGSIDPPADIIPGRNQPSVHFWEGRDIADRWPEFKKQMDLLPRDLHTKVCSGNVVSGDENERIDESLDSSEEDEGSEDLNSSNCSDISEDKAVKKEDNFIDIRDKITEDMKESCSSVDESSEDNSLSTEDERTSNENGDSGENFEIFDMLEENLELQDVKIKEVYVELGKMLVGENNDCDGPVMMNKDHSTDVVDHDVGDNYKDLEESCSNFEYNSEDSLLVRERNSSSSEIGDSSDNSKVDYGIDDKPELLEVKIIDAEKEVIELPRYKNSDDIKAFNYIETLHEED